MGPLDMRGLVGAAAIMGCLKFGVSGLVDLMLMTNCCCNFLLKDEDLLEDPDNCAFLHGLSMISHLADSRMTLADNRMSGFDHRQVLGSLHPAVRR